MPMCGCTMLKLMHISAQTMSRTSFRSSVHTAWTMHDMRLCEGHLHSTSSLQMHRVLDGAHGAAVALSKPADCCSDMHGPSNDHRLTTRIRAQGCRSLRKDFEQPCLQPMSAAHTAQQAIQLAGIDIMTIINLS